MSQWAVWPSFGGPSCQSRGTGCVAVMRVAATGEFEGSRGWDAIAVDGRSDALSLLALRQRSIRLWLAGIGFLAFGAAYVSPIALSFTQPTAAPAVVLPRLTLPLVDFPTLAVPKLHAAPTLDAAGTSRTTRTSTPQPAAERRVVRRAAPQSTPTRRVERHDADDPRRHQQLLGPTSCAEGRREGEGRSVRKATVVIDSVGGVPEEAATAATATETTDVTDSVGVVPPTFGDAPVADDGVEIVDDSVGPIVEIDDTAPTTTAAAEDTTAATEPAATDETNAASPYTAPMKTPTDAAAGVEVRAAQLAGPPPAPSPGTTDTVEPTTSPDATATTGTARRPLPRRRPRPRLHPRPRRPLLRRCRPPRPPRPTRLPRPSPRPPPQRLPRPGRSTSRPARRRARDRGHGDDTDISVTVDGVDEHQVKASVTASSSTGPTEPTRSRSTPRSPRSACRSPSRAAAARTPCAGRSRHDLDGHRRRRRQRRRGRVHRVENLAGAANNKDTFVFEAGAALAGTIDGGDGGFDTLVVNGDQRSFVSTPASASSGTVALDGKELS